MPISGSKIRKSILPVLLGALVLVFGHPWLCRAEITAIRGYQRVGSPIMRHVSACRFTPSCSHYAIQVLRSDGFYKGNARVAKRLALCSPLGYLLE